MKDTIAIIWHIEDVKGLDETLTDNECREILQAVKRNHDATIGVNWDTIQYYINELKETKLTTK